MLRLSGITRDATQNHFRAVVAAAKLAVLKDTSESEATTDPQDTAASEQAVN